MSEYYDFRTPVGRIVQGSVSRGNTTDRNGVALTYKSGPNAGQPCTNWFFSLAIPKGAEFDQFWAGVEGFARQNAPQLSQRPNYAWKRIDGDSQEVNEAGKRWCDYEGFPGHWVLRFSTTLQAPGVYRLDGSGNYLPMPGEECKTGHYAVVAGSVGLNSDQTKPGIFLNPSKILHVGYGVEINAGLTAEQAFAGVKPVLPPGASATPVGPAAAAQPPAAPTTPTVPVAPPPPVVPHHGILNPSASVPPPPPAPVNAEPVYIIGGQRYTESQLRAAAYTDAQLTGLQRA